MKNDNNKNQCEQCKKKSSELYATNAHTPYCVFLCRKCYIKKHGQDDFNEFNKYDTHDD